MRTSTIANLGGGLTRLVVVGFIMLAGNLWAVPAAIEGIVKDASGRPLSGADIRIENRGGGGETTVVKTNQNGYYFYGWLKPGHTYRVSLLVDSVVKASINNVTPRIGDPTALNFAVKTVLASAPSAAHHNTRHFVWLPAQTGTNIGGSWVEVGQTTVGAQRVDTYNRSAIEQILRNSSIVGSNLSSKEEGSGVYLGDPFYH